MGPPGQEDGNRPRDLAESDLTRALQAAFSQPGFRASLSGKEGADELLAEVEEAAYQVFVAHKFYNDLAAVTRDARNRPLARVLHLSGHAEAPVFFEMDDSLIADKPGAPWARPPWARLAIRWCEAVLIDQARFECPLSTPTALSRGDDPPSPPRRPPSRPSGPHG